MYNNDGSKNSFFYIRCYISKKNSGFLCKDLSLFILMIILIIILKNILVVILVDILMDILMDILVDILVNHFDRYFRILIVMKFIIYFNYNYLNYIIIKL